MFVPLPVPLVFQRTAPDFSAWRLKSPLPLRSGNSGVLVLKYCISEGAGARNVCAQRLAFNEAEIFQPADGFKRMRHL
ncbi:hypothetical protein QQF64_013119 [Cirrhinus molitorella]|uniref:Uncharacterized protein n=1 Tax=Cirrhinus molitorella TaxID=172907 RepID=A0ABR3LQ81_9TELE